MEKANNHTLEKEPFPLSCTKRPHLAIFVVLLCGHQENDYDTRYFYILRLDRWFM